MSEYMRKRYTQRRKEAVRKLGGACSRCGVRKNLQVDHIDRTKKEMGTARMMIVGKERFERELLKCQLLCGDCHVEKTTFERGLTPARGTHGTLSSYRYCHCEVCKEGKRKYVQKYKRNGSRSRTRA